MEISLVVALYNNTVCANNNTPIQGTESASGTKFYWSRGVVYDRYRPTDESDDSDAPLSYDILEITSTSNPSQYIFNSNQSEGHDRRNRERSLWVAHQVIAVGEVFTTLALSY